MPNTTILWVINIYSKLYELKVLVLGIVLLGVVNLENYLVGDSWAMDGVTRRGLWDPGLHLCLLYPFLCPSAAPTLLNRGPKQWTLQKHDLIQPFLLAA